MNMFLLSIVAIVVGLVYLALCIVTHKDKEYYYPTPLTRKGIIVKDNKGKIIYHRF